MDRYAWRKLGPFTQWSRENYKDIKCPEQYEYYSKHDGSLKWNFRRKLLPFIIILQVNSQV